MGSVGEACDRNRVCRITEEWTVPIIAEYVDDAPPGARLFTFNARTAWDHHIAAENGDAEQGIARLVPHAPEGSHYEHTTLHDHRHTYEVNNRKRGIPDSLIAHQLGHANTVLIREAIRAVCAGCERFRAMDYGDNGGLT